MGMQRCLYSWDRQTEVNDSVVVVGASGFGREALDVLEAMKSAGANIDIKGVVDDLPSQTNLERLRDRGVAYLGSIDSWLSDEQDEAAFVLGIGNPQVRRRLVGKLEARGRRPHTAVHPTASIGSRTRFSEGLVICAGAVISTNVHLGRHVHINPNATIGHDAVLGDFVSVNPAAVISGEVHVEEAVLVGAASTTLQGITIGHDAVVGAGAVITRGIEPFAIHAGVPGKPMAATAGGSSR